MIKEATSPTTSQEIRERQRALQIKIYFAQAKTGGWFSEEAVLLADKLGDDKVTEKLRELYPDRKDFRGSYWKGEQWDNYVARAERLNLTDEERKMLRALRSQVNIVEVQSED